MSENELEEWSKQNEIEKQKRIAKIEEELGDVMTDLDREIVSQWAFELDI